MVKRFVGDNEKAETVVKLPSVDFDPTPEREIIPEDRRTVEPKYKFIVIAVAIVLVGLWVMSRF